MTLPRCQSDLLIRRCWGEARSEHFFFFARSNGRLAFAFRASFVLSKPLKMNMVKRIMGRPRQEECSPQDNALGLMHLRRLFSELCHPPRHMTQKEQEEKLYMMLPVFNRVREVNRLPLA